METKYLTAARLLLAAFILTAPAALAQPASPGSTGQAVADVHHLSNQVRGVIKNVEKADLPCVTRNNIVRRLRQVDGALLTGNRSAASGLLAAWIAQARSMHGAGLLSAPQGAMLQVSLGNILPQIGVGSVKNPRPIVRWPPLPRCDSTTGAGGLGATSGYEVWQPSDTRVIVQSAVTAIPFVGKLLAPIVAVFWPTGAPDVSSIISATLKTQLAADLEGLKIGVQIFEQYESAWQADCQTYGLSSSQCRSGATFVASQWGALNLDLQQREPKFRLKGYEVELLPFYAQFMNLYLTFLREGALLVQGWPSESTALGQIPQQTIQAVLNTADSSRFLGFVNATYKLGLDQQPSPDNTAKWATRNKYIRDVTLQVLDFRDIWPLMDPAAYPKGLPGFRLTRMIYSDPIGKSDYPMVDPDYADGPLQDLTIWTGYNRNKDWWFIDGVQFTGGPTSGPAVTSPIMGDPALSGEVYRYDYDVRPGSPLGPVVTAGGWDKVYVAFGQRILARLYFTFADGTSRDFGWQKWESIDCGATCTQSYSFHYEDEVMASMRVMGLYSFGAYRGEGADSIVFGFRYADSFYPSGQVINAGTGGCMTTLSPPLGVVDSPCKTTPDKFWTYYSPFRELRVWGGTQCLEAPSTMAGTQLKTQPCNHGPSQQWTVSPGAGGGTMTGVQSGLVVGSSGGSLQLQNNTGAATQKWKTFSHVQGPVHALGAGKCLAVNTATNGTPVQIYTCNGLSSTQTWVYSPSMQTFSFPGWTQCLTARGSAAGSLVEINACTGGASQQWREELTGAITHVHSGLVLDVNGTADGSPVRLWPYSGASNQQWTWPMN